MEEDACGTLRRLSGRRAVKGSDQGLIKRKMRAKSLATQSAAREAGARNALQHKEPRAKRVREIGTQASGASRLQGREEAKGAGRERPVLAVAGRDG